MGFLDNLAGMFSPRTPNFNPNSPTSIYDPTDEERKKAFNMALMQAGVGILANNKGNYGQALPAIGAGLQQGLQGYQENLAAGPANRMKQMQQQLYGQQIQAQVEASKAKAMEDQQDEKQASFFLKTAGLNPDDLGNDLVRYAGISANPIAQTSPIAQPQTDFSKSIKPIPELSNEPVGKLPDYSFSANDIEVNPAKPKTPFDKIADQLGWSQAEKEMFAAQVKADPKEAAKMLNEDVKAWRKSVRSGKKEGGTKISFEDAMILKSEGENVPGYENYSSDVARKYLGKKNTGRKASAPSQNVYTGGGIPAGEATKNISKEFGKFAQAATENAQNASDTADDISMIEQGLKGMGGGPVAKFKAWAGQVFPPDSDLGKMASMSELASTVQAKLAPQARAVGSGATSDFEMRMYMQAIPTLSTTENGRALMAKYARRVAERQQVRAEIVNDIEQEGKLPTPAEIKRRMGQRLGDTFFDAQDKSFFGIKESDKPQPKTVDQLPKKIESVPKGVNPNDWKYMTPEERKLWK